MLANVLHGDAPALASPASAGFPLIRGDARAGSGRAVTNLSGTV
jgi:hypothetical protein